MRLYTDRFNRRDWDGALELITADARLNVLDRFAGKLADTSYFGNYEKLPLRWKLTPGAVDGEPVIIILEGSGDTWSPYSIIRLSVHDQRIGHIVDYVHCPWILSTVTTLEAEG